MSKSTKQKLRNIHPGEVLRKEFLIPLGISQYRLAKEIGVTEARISAICSGKRAITADTALRLAAFFGTTAPVNYQALQGWPRQNTRRAVHGCHRGNTL